MVGGFLGAGKTTAIARLAKHYSDQGLSVGLVTNDQAYGLVDTELLRSQGFRVGEVPGACFCCKFDDLVETVAQLGRDGQPDLIITEPVGSCTDLVSTVVKPLSHLYGDRYDIGPLSVLCKPEHGRKILGGGTGGFTPQAAYIFLKQLEEAQFIVLNKCDKLTKEQREELLGLIAQRFPEKRVLSASARTGEGFDEFLELLAEDLDLGQPSMEVDYDTYAEGEAALGWLNANARVSSASDSHAPWSLDRLVVRLVESLDSAFVQSSMEPGHVKVLAAAERHTSVANWVASGSPVELSVSSSAQVAKADLLVNVRLHGDPDKLASIVESSLQAVARELNLQYQTDSLQHFRPGRPVPVHRYSGTQG